jgi:hypothetical protein
MWLCYGQIHTSYVVLDRDDHLQGVDLAAFAAHQGHGNHSELLWRVRYRRRNVLRRAAHAYLLLSWW